jgi:hypothetical protein
MTVDGKKTEVELNRELIELVQGVAASLETGLVTCQGVGDGETERVGVVDALMDIGHALRNLTGAYLLVHGRCVGCGRPLGGPDHRCEPSSN